MCTCVIYLALGEGNFLLYWHLGEFFQVGRLVSKIITKKFQAGTPKNK